MDTTFPRRMQLKFLIPESNPAFDSYRIGTVLEMVRASLGCLPAYYIRNEPAA